MAWIVHPTKMPEQVGSDNNPSLDLGTSPNPSGAYAAPLGREWGQFFAGKRSSPTRKKERRQLRHLAKFGEVRFVDIQEADDRKGSIELLFNKRTRSFARMGVKNIFAPSGCRELFIDIV